jgi:hypothetical protein
VQDIRVLAVTRGFRRHRSFVRRDGGPGGRERGRSESLDSELAYARRERERES